MSDDLVINEIYLSLQGESTWAGLPCIFVRLTACNLRCSYCDTAYAFSEGKKMPLGEILAEVRRLATQHDTAHTPHFKLPLVELTGGEPLLQNNSLPLMQALCDEGFTVLLETSGAAPPPIVQYQVGTEEDYEWAKRQIREHNLAMISPLLVSWVHPLAPGQQHPSLKTVPGPQTPISRRALAERIISDHLPVRFQAQLHKIIWPADQRGV